MLRRQTISKAAECEWCGRKLAAGSRATVDLWNGETFCNAVHAHKSRAFDTQTSAIVGGLGDFFGAVDRWLAAPL